MLQQEAPVYAREEWVAASRFEPCSDDDVLRLVEDRVRDEMAQHVGSEFLPVVIFDLDSTLYEVQPRTFAIIQEWLAARDSAAVVPKVRSKVAGLTCDQLRYSINDALQAAGLDNDDAATRAAADSLKQFWSQRFFRSDYLHFDRPYAGAMPYATKLYDMGCQIIYLTGRDEPQMGDGTRAMLTRDGFTLNGKRAKLMLKPNFEMDDQAFKRVAVETISAMGPVVASFENEPLNFVTLQKLLPNTVHVFVDTICSDRPASPADSAYRVGGFIG